MSKICENRTTIVTGAGSGLGRAHALALADEGANVVVNDINVDAAVTVVEEIKGAGGKAIVDRHDITSWEESGKIIKSSLETFGDIHAVVNNAGIVRDRMFTSMSEQEWDAVIEVHLKGHFCVTNHAARYWREQFKAGREVSGRIINTSSAAGLQGSIAQSNYAAAKGGIATLTLVQAAEMNRYGVTANTLAPQARTGMTEVLFSEMMKKPEFGFDIYDPANVSPLVVWLASAFSGDITGCCFEIFGGKISVADGWRTGPEFDKGERWIPSEIGESVRKLVKQAVPPQKIYGT
ncbi:MAG: short-chain dehydrogenase [Candidatus Marinimicrobia bacterium]|nr:short-chain dehydrogenase [Candidatus Neomarinimicrobiota bacterium]